jgi:hypothetical protein
LIQNLVDNPNNLFEILSSQIDRVAASPSGSAPKRAKFDGLDRYRDHPFLMSEDEYRNLDPGSAPHFSLVVTIWEKVQGLAEDPSARNQLAGAFAHMLGFYRSRRNGIPLEDQQGDRDLNRFYDLLTDMQQKLLAELGSDPRMTMTIPAPGPPPPPIQQQRRTPRGGFQSGPREVRPKTPSARPEVFRGRVRGRGRAIFGQHPRALQPRMPLNVSSAVESRAPLPPVSILANLSVLSNMSNGEPAWLSWFTASVDKMPLDLSVFVPEDMEQTPDALQNGRLMVNRFVVSVPPIPVTFKLFEAPTRVLILGGAWEFKDFPFTAENPLMKETWGRIQVEHVPEDPFFRTPFEIHELALRLQRKSFDVLVVIGSFNEVEKREHQGLRSLLHDNMGAVRRAKLLATHICVDLDHYCRIFQRPLVFAGMGLPRPRYEEVSTAVGESSYLERVQPIYRQMSTYFEALRKRFADGGVFFVDCCLPGVGLAMEFCTLPQGVVPKWQTAMNWQICGAAVRAKLGLLPGDYDPSDYRRVRVESDKKLAKPTVQTKAAAEKAAPKPPPPPPKV